MKKMILKRAAEKRVRGVTSCIDKPVKVKAKAKAKPKAKAVKK